jgi:oxygen-independent coproporphyrinogen-3 oxidase
MNSTTWESMYPSFLPIDRVTLVSQLAVPEMPQHIDGGAPGTLPLLGDAAQRMWTRAAPETAGRRMLYLHVPFCRNRCSFCGFYMNPTTEEDVRAYLELLLRELEHSRAHDPFTGAPIGVVYFGGGTPTDIPADGLYRLIRFIRERFTLTPDVEFTVEGRLFGFDDDKVRACDDAGATRFSFGVQTFNTQRRRGLGRRLSREEIVERLIRIKALCGDRVAVIADLIYGLPGQTHAEWLEDIRTVHEDVPLDGMDLYRLKLLPGIPLLAQAKREAALTEDELLRRYVDASALLRESGWNRLSLSHWGRNALERNHYNHWAKTGADILPYGCGAGGALGDWSFMQTSDLADYRAKVEAGAKPLAVAMKKTPTHRLRAQVVDQMERGFLDPKSFCAVDFGPLYENWAAAGVWAQDDAGRYRLSPLGEFYQTRLATRVQRFCLSQAAGGEA